MRGKSAALVANMRSPILQYILIAFRGSMNVANDAVVWIVAASLSQDVDENLGSGRYRISSISLRDMHISRSHRRQGRWINEVECASSFI